MSNNKINKTPAQNTKDIIDTNSFFHSMRGGYIVGGLIFIIVFLFNIISLEGFYNIIFSTTPSLIGLIGFLIVFSKTYKSNKHAVMWALVVNIVFSVSAFFMIFFVLLGLALSDTYKTSYEKLFEINPLIADFVLAIILPSIQLIILKFVLNLPNKPRNLILGTITLSIILNVIIAFLFGT